MSHRIHSESITSQDSFRKEQKNLFLKLTILVVFILIAALASYSVVHSLMTQEEERRSALLARTAAAKDLEMRDWISTLGGIYAPITDITPPNPYLPLKNRDITLPDGTEMTKLNPAYVTRLLHERWGDKYEMVGHISSTMPMRPENMSHDWEAQALERLKISRDAESTEVRIDETTGKLSIFYITPLRAKESCLTCHTTQGYKVGDIMGGLSNVVPISQITGEDKQLRNSLLFGYILFTCMLILIVIFGGRSIMKRNNARFKAEMNLKDLADNLETRVQQRTLELEHYEAKLREERDLLNSIVNNSPMPMYIVDYEDVVRVINPAAQNLLGLSLGCQSRIAWENVEEQQELYKKVKNNIDVKDYNARFKISAHNVILETRTNITQVIYEGQAALLVWVQDVSDLVHAKEQAENFSRAKSDFLARMSHEIRTPMNAILGMTHLFLQNPLEDWQKLYLYKIQNAAKGLLGIINDILDFSKIEAGKMVIEISPFSLEKMVENIGHVCVPMAEDKKLEFLFSMDPALPDAFEGDSLRITQVLTNIISNAIKFTDAGEVALYIYALETSAEYCTLKFEIKDTGIGMSEEQISRLFQAFEQADVSTTRKYGGTGLGLVISDQLVRMMGGEIQVNSTPYKGSTFFFQLKLKLQKDVKNIAYNSLASGERILVVDDNELSLKILQNMLEGFGFHVEAVTSGHLACDAVFQDAYDGKPYDVVLLDCKMPGMDGFECAKRILELPMAAHPQLIMISAHGLEEYMKKGQLYGFSDYISKPFSRNALWNTLAKSLGKENYVISTADTQQKVQEKDLVVIKGAQVLLVEDNETNQEVAGKLLRRVGMEVEIASNGLEALMACKTNTYDLIFMDIQMPIMDGLESAKRIRTESKTCSDAPIVAMTAHAMASDKEKSLEAGMNDHITKPIDPEILYAVLLKWIPPKTEEVPKEEVKEEMETADNGLGFHIPGLDLSKALCYLGNDMDSVKLHLQQFPGRYAKYPDQITTCIARMHWAEANRTAHTLKSVSATLGMTSISALAADLEKAYANQTTDDAKLNTLSTELAAICAIIQKHFQLESVSDSNTESSNQLDEFEEAIKEIKVLPKLLNSDLHACMVKIKELKKYVPAIVSVDQYTEVFSAIYEFNHDTARQVIENLINDLEKKK